MRRPGLWPWGLEQRLRMYSRVTRSYPVTSSVRYAVDAILCPFLAVVWAWRGEKTSGTTQGTHVLPRLCPRPVCPGPQKAFGGVAATEVACVVTEHSGGAVYSDRNIVWVQQCHSLTVTVLSLCSGGWCLSSMLLVALPSCSLRAAFSCTSCAPGV